MSAAESLTHRAAEELACEAPAAPRSLSDAIVARYGASVAAVLFYGSCLRQDTHEGVLDLYVLVDDYATAYPASLYLRLANRLIAPNVFFLVLEDETLGTLRCKYAVISKADFARGVRAESRHPYIWARFSQPARLIYARDSESRDFVAKCAAESVVTLVRRLSCFLPAHGRNQRFSPAALWQEAFRRTYACELRTESEETVRGNYEADPARYDALAGLALEQLARDGWLESVTVRGASFEIEMSPQRRLLARARWHALRPFCKLLAFGRLVKNATTFGEWVPYILWKIERHSGARIEPTERQLRHPFIYGWPILARLLWRREIR